MPVRIGSECIKKASDEELENKVWLMWLSLYPHMTKETFISFGEYKDKILQCARKPKQQTDEQMLAMAKMLNAAFGGTMIDK